jgi:hypothetical protein
MATADPILTVLARVEERLSERIEDRFRDLQLDLDGRFDAIHQSLDGLEDRRLAVLEDRVQEIERRLPPE